MHPDCIDFEDCRNAFISDMKDGLEGKHSSLLMIPSYLSVDGQAAEGDTAIAVDIGGTNLRIALTQFRNGSIHVLESVESPVPGLKNAITKAAFFNEIADRLRPVIEKSSRIGVCFSHAAEILPDRDGRLISFSKEITVLGAEGMEITKELSKTLFDRGHREKKSYVLLNDTTAVLLGGAAISAGQAYDCYIGFVLGTGKNLCYVEKTAEIKKLGGAYPFDTMIVNTESGYFTRVFTGVIDRELDSITANPGTHTLEKMTSGRYLGQLILLTLQKAASEGLLSAGAGASVLTLGDLQLADISGFLAGMHGKNTLSDLCKTVDDREVLYTVAAKLIERAAKLSVMSIAAVMEKTDKGRRPESPVCIVAEGSTFHKLFSFKEHFGGYVQRYINEKQKRYCQVEQVENATLLGSSFAALIN
jgi:hexokinase